MTTNFPGELDSFVNPAPADSVVEVDHAAQHANANDAIEAVQAKVGADASADQDSHDYKLQSITAADQAASKAVQDAHVGDTNNPHEVSKAQVGLGNVDNTSDATKNAAIAILENKTIDADDNIIDNLEVDNFKTGVIDPDGTLAANSGTRLPTQAAVKSYVDSGLSGAGAILPFGDGHDGSAIISTNTTLTEDKYYTDLTVNGKPPVKAALR